MPLDTALWTLLSTLLGGMFFRERVSSVAHFGAGCTLTVFGILLFSWGTALNGKDEEMGDGDEEAMTKGGKANEKIGGGHQQGDIEPLINNQG